MGRDIGRGARAVGFGEDVVYAGGDDGAGAGQPQGRHGGVARELGSIEIGRVERPVAFLNRGAVGVDFGIRHELKRNSVEPHAAAAGRKQSELDGLRIAVDITGHLAAFPMRGLQGAVLHAVHRDFATVGAEAGQP